MGLIDQQYTNRVPYSPADTYCALTIAIQTLKGYIIDRTDDKIMTIYINKKLSAFSWGERIRVSVSPVFDGTSDVTIISTPKAAIQALDISGATKANMEAIFAALSHELDYYSPINLKINNQDSILDVADEIRKLAELMNSGILTQEEFAAKKRQLLNL